ncbi:MAG TPA: DUF4214 domain-containing protein [Telluria sp.]|nr:DUF4214 domain-containing protein [Telluria sp.]
MTHARIASLFFILLCGCSDQSAVNRPTLTASGGVVNATNQNTTPYRSAQVDGYRADYNVTIEGAGVRVVHKVSGAISTFDSVDRLEFIDRITVLGSDGIEAAVYRLYQAAFDRKPDAYGLGFWVDAAGKGTPLRDIALGFMASPEFAALYGSGDARSFLERVYRNVLHREPDAGGLDWWIGSLTAGTPRVDALLGFSESGENKANVSPDFVAGLDFAPYRSLADHTAVSMNLFTMSPVETHTNVIVAIQQLEPDRFMLTSAYWDFSRAGADRFRAGSQYLMKWNGSGLVDDAASVSGGIPAMYAAETTGAVADVNHDGVLDVVLGGNGPDGEGDKSEPSHLLLSRGTGFVRVPIPNGAMAPTAHSWAHGLTTIQRRGQSNRSIFIGDFVYGPSYIVNLDTVGQASIGPGLLPSFLGSPTKLSWANSFAADMGTTAALGVDLDNDGAEELVVGTLFTWIAEHTNPTLNTMQTVVLSQDANGSFANAEPVALPNGPFPKRDCYQRSNCGSLTVKQIAATDFNVDGQRDLLVTHHIYGSDIAGVGYTGSYPQVLINKGGMKFEDATLAYFGKDMVDLAGGYVHSHPFDLNGDACPDVVLRGDANNSKQPRVFLNNCKGRLVEFTAEFLKLIPKIDGVHEQMHGGVPVMLGGKPAVLLWSGTGTYITNVHAVRFLSKIPTPATGAVTF